MAAAWHEASTSAGLNASSAYDSPSFTGATLAAVLDEGVGTDDIIFFCIYYTILASLCLLCLVGNSMVIAAILRTDKLRMPTNCFLFSLAMSDLVQGISYFTYQISHIASPGIKRTIGNWYACVFILGIVLAQLRTSSYCLVAETMNRFVAVKWPIVFRNLTWTKMAIAAVTVWLVGHISAHVVNIRMEAPDHYAGVCRYEFINGEGHIKTMLAASFLLPLVLMILMYVGICFLLQRQRRKIFHRSIDTTANSTTNKDAMKPAGTRVTEDQAGKEESTAAPPDTNAKANAEQNKKPTADPKKSNSTKNENKLVTTAAVLLAYFIASWLPFCTYAYVSILCKDCEINRYVRAMVRLMLYSNCAMNVVIYAGRNNDFRKSFKRDLRALYRLIRRT